MPDASPSAASASGSSDQAHASDPPPGSAASLAYRTAPEKIVLPARPGGTIGIASPVRTARAGPGALSILTCGNRAVVNFPVNAAASPAHFAGSPLQLPGL